MIRVREAVVAHDVLEAASGKQALTLFQQAGRPIDLLLTDMVMPDGVSGQELAEQMSARSPRLRILYTSGYHINMVGGGLTEQEGVSFLQKPFSMQKLAGAVRDCLNRAPAAGG